MADILLHFTPRFWKQECYLLGTARSTESYHIANIEIEITKRASRFERATIAENAAKWLEACARACEGIPTDILSQMREGELYDLYMEMLQKRQAQGEG